MGAPAGAAWVCGLGSRALVVRECLLVLSSGWGACALTSTGSVRASCRPGWPVGRFVAFVEAVMAVAAVAPVVRVVVVAMVGAVCTFVSIFRVQQEPAERGRRAKQRTAAGEASPNMREVGINSGVS